MKRLTLLKLGVNEMLLSKLIQVTSSYFFCWLRRSVVIT
jgi:hypothetical protein